MSAGASSAAAEPDPVCIVCRNPSTRHCARCKTIYCSRACQADDWPIHYPLCKPLATKFRDEHRPDIGFFRAIFFPAKLTRPRLRWLDRNAADLRRRVMFTDNPQMHIPQCPGIFSTVFPYFANGKGPSPNIVTRPLNRSILALGPPGYLIP